MDQSGVTAETPKGPWGPAAPTAPPCSLADVMSEQLARQLEEEDHTFPSATSPAPGAPDAACDTTSDLMLAQVLQLQFDREFDEQLRREERKFNGDSKVSISFENYRMVHPYEDSDSSEDEVDWQDTRHDPYRAEKPQTAPRRGFAGKGKNITTKHDEVACGRKNTARMDNFAPEVHVGDGVGMDLKLSNQVFNALKQHDHSEQRRSARLHDKKEHSTAEQAVDPRTRLLMFKMVSAGVLENINGCISTGKESVVFHADGGRWVEPSVSNRGQSAGPPLNCHLCVCQPGGHARPTGSGAEGVQDHPERVQEPRPLHQGRLPLHRPLQQAQPPQGHPPVGREGDAQPEQVSPASRRRPRPGGGRCDPCVCPVRMRKAGVPCPDVVLLRKHILVMSFIGRDHSPAPKLKDAALSPEDMADAYQQVLQLMQVLFQDCNLVHADLSEYNILWHDGKAWLIDVSQSVEPTHPHGLEFLFRDCRNISTFFQKRGVGGAMSAFQLFNAVSGLDVPVGEENEAEFIAEIVALEKRNEDHVQRRGKKAFPAAGEEAGPPLEPDAYD
ncbi:serine/threonine-protein kinase RIO3 isoform X1 [Antennarius striatus]|uniref:serine/threonine-protein kinase RIO3 isoform X1 n=1 Tax=Antennarius striatus TaxID=241820 RepID=UPI0035B17468